MWAEVLATSARRRFGDRTKERRDSSPQPLGWFEIALTLMLAMEPGSRSAGTHYVTLRLVDALPRPVVEAWHDDVDRHTARLTKAKGRPLTEHESREVAHRSLGRMDRVLNQGRGRAVLRDERAASAVESTLWGGDGERYRLHAWVVMPNHVHALVTPCPGHSIGEIVGEWRTESARRVNAELRRTGPLWHPDTIDHVLIHPSDLARVRASIVADPDQASLHEWPFAGETVSRR